MSMNLLPGNTLLTASGQVGTANKPIRVFSVSILSGGTAGDISLKNGGSSGTIYEQLVGTASQSAVFNFAGGVRFPDGCYLTENVAPTSTLIVYTEEF